MDNLNTYDALLRYGEITVARMAKVLKDTEHLKNQIAPEVKVSPEGNMQLVINIPDWGIFVDQGRRPWGIDGRGTSRSSWNRFPPPRPIEQWAKSKGLPQFRDSKGRYISHASRTFLISRAIARDGIKPRPFRYLVSEHIAQLDHMLGEGAAKDIAIALTENFNSLPNATANI